MPLDFDVCKETDARSGAAFVAEPVLSGVFMHGPKISLRFRDGLNKESIAAIAVLQERWPAAFPKKSRLVLALSGNLIAPIAESTGWSKRYTAGVLIAWKRRDAYARAVLRCERRYDLTGAATDETISDGTRALATEQLARLALRRQEKAEQDESARANPCSDSLTASRLRRVG